MDGIDTPISSFYHMDDTIPWQQNSQLCQVDGTVYHPQINIMASLLTVTLWTLGSNLHAPYILRHTKGCIHVVDIYIHHQAHMHNTHSISKYKDIHILESRNCCMPVAKLSALEFIACLLLILW